MRRRRRKSSNKRVLNISSPFKQPIDRIAEIRADQIREGRRMMAAEAQQKIS